MKFIKWTLIILVVLAAVICTVGFLSPAHVHVERSIVIKAPASIVHEYVNNLKNWTKWSPWYKMDTAMKIEYHGPEAGAGAGYKWSSTNKNVGNGDMTITASTQDSISTAMNFMENGTATGNFIFSSSDSGTKVTWTMDSDMGMNPIGRIFGLLMDKMLGPDFEKGLAGLKETTEAVPTGPKTYRGYEVMEEDGADIVYIGKKDSMGWDKIEGYYKDNIMSIMEALMKAKVDIAGPPCSMYFKWDSVTHTALMAVAVPVKADAKVKVKGYETIVIPHGKNLHIIYTGGYTGIGAAHYAMDDYMKEKNLIQGTPVIEEYVSGPGKEEDSTKWVTNVFYPVK